MSGCHFPVSRSRVTSILPLFPLAIFPMYSFTALQLTSIDPSPDPSPDPSTISTQRLLLLDTSILFLRSASSTPCTPSPALYTSSGQAMHRWQGWLCRTSFSNGQHNSTVCYWAMLQMRIQQAGLSVVVVALTMCLLLLEYYSKQIYYQGLLDYCSCRCRIAIDLYYCSICLLSPACIRKGGIRLLQATHTIGPGCR